MLSPITWSKPSFQLDAVVHVKMLGCGKIFTDDAEIVANMFSTRCYSCSLFFHYVSKTVFSDISIESFVLKNCKRNCRFKIYWRHLHVHHGGAISTDVQHVRVPEFDTKFVKERSQVK